MKQYDIIGDIHGHALELIALLKKLGYAQHNGCYKHSDRVAIFTGDFIDGGLHNEEVINIVRPMVDSGAAYAVMGNHEYNAICYHTLHPKTGVPLREHSTKNTKQHRAFLNEFDGKPKQLEEIISWFKELPLFLDLGHLRIVHAEWNQNEIDSVKIQLSDKNEVSDDFIIRSAQIGSKENGAVECLLKGSEATLPDGISFKDKYGHERYEGRLCWWEKSRKTESLFMVPDDVKNRLSELSINSENFISYDATMPPVFFGHYWLSGCPSVQSENAVCVDYSVAKEGGKLCCYAFNNNERVSADNFCFVNRFES
ncbi:MAG: metallophosphoesterase [Candidatus Marinimicrobia bacterium]|nr:metallophosphoesterase [Candidatus Neomarinimicrobiota bacterium]